MSYPRIISGLILICTCTVNQSFAETTIIRAARMIDVTTGELISPASIVVESNMIVAVNPEAPPAGVESIDLGDRTLLPGLLDMHTHLTLDFFTGNHWTTAAIKETPADWALYGVEFGRQTLNAGFTTVRDAGAWPGFPDLALWPPIKAGQLPGPQPGHTAAREGSGRPRRRRAGGPRQLRPRQRDEPQRSPPLVHGEAARHPP